ARLYVFYDATSLLPRQPFPTRRSSDLITLGKRGDLHARRKVMTTIKDKGVVHELFTEIAPAMAERQGGYTRITKTAPRKGDNARSEEHTSELQSRENLVCRLLLEKKNK